MLGHLLELAHLIEGCWVVRSDVLFPDGYLSPVTKMAAPGLRAGRDYLVRVCVCVGWCVFGMPGKSPPFSTSAQHHQLLQFQQGCSVTRVEAAQATGLQSADIKDMLDMLARLRVLDPGRARWCFKFDPDREFTAAHRAVAADAAARWALFAPGAEATLEKRRREPAVASAAAAATAAAAAVRSAGKAAAAAQPPGSKAAGSAAAAAAAGGGPASAAAAAAIDAAAVASVVAKTLGEAGVCRLDTLRHVLARTLPAVADLDDAALAALLDRAAPVRVAGTSSGNSSGSIGAARRYVLRRGPLAAADPLRDVVLGLFEGAAVVRKRQVVEQAERAHVPFEDACVFACMRYTAFTFVLTKHTRTHIPDLQHVHARDERAGRGQRARIFAQGRARGGVAVGYMFLANSIK